MTEKDKLEARLSDEKRITHILKNGIIPPAHTEQHGYDSPYFWSAYRNQKDFSYFGIGNKLFQVWMGSSSGCIATIFLDNKFVKNNAALFKNGSYKSVHGKFITSQRAFIDDLMDNREYYNTFLNETDIEDTNADIMRSIHQLVSSSAIPPESYGKIVFYNKDIMENVKSLVPDKVKIYLAPNGIHDKAVIERIL